MHNIVVHMCMQLCACVHSHVCVGVSMCVGVYVFCFLM